MPRISELPINSTPTVDAKIPHVDAGVTQWATLGTLSLFQPAGPGAVVQSTQEQLRKHPHPSNYVSNADYVTAAKALRTGQLFAEDGAVIHRLSDRLLIGDGIDCTGDNAATGTSWLGVGPQPGLGWIEKNATLVAYASKGSIGIAGAARTSQMTSGASIGIAGIGYNNNSVNTIGAWGLYLEGKSAAGALGHAIGAEIQAVTLGAYVDYYSASTNKTYGILLGAGADAAVNGPTNSATVAISVSNNGADFGRGIAFGAGALRAHTDVEGLTHYKAIVLRNAQQIGWEDSSGGSLGFIRSTVAAAASEVSMRMSNNNIFLEGVGGKEICQFLHTANGVNYALIGNAVAGTGALYSVAGTDADIDLRLVPKGVGLVRFGAFTASGDVAVTGSVSIKTTDGTIRKLATIA